MKPSRLTRKTELKRTGAMRRVSKKRAKLMREVAPERKAFLESAGECMTCFRKLNLECHEITRGPAREAALQQPTLWLALCHDCHHGNVGGWSIAKQLAVRIAWDIKRKIALANHIRGRSENGVTLEEVMEELEGWI